MCVSGCVCAGVYGDTLAAMEASAGPDRMGYTPHHGLHLHLQRPHHSALGPGNLISQPGSDLGCIFFVASDFYNMILETCRHGNLTQQNTMYTDVKKLQNYYLISFLIFPTSSI